MKWSISTKVLLPMGVLFMLFFLAQSYLINQSTQRILLETSRNRAQEMADAAVLALEADLGRSNFTRVATNLASSEEVEFVIFVDKQSNQIIASSSFKYRKDIIHLPDELRERVQSGLKTRKSQFVDLGNNDFWFSYNIRTVPKGSKELKNYLMLIKWSGEVVNKAIEDANQIHFLYLFLGSIIFASLGYALFWQFTLNPLNRLMNSINRKESGEPYKDLPDDGYDEFQLLSNSLYQMSVTELKSLEAMEKAKEKAEDMSALKSAFLANMSHEIRTPINGILGLVQVAQKSDNPEQIQQYLQKIFLSGQTLVGIINDILDFSKLAAGKVVIDNIDFCPDQLVEQVIELCRNNADLKGLKLHANLAADLPLSIRSDPLRLHQILLNLVNNAVKFTESGSVTIDMSMELTEEQIWLKGKVIDTGIGIPEVKQKTLFDEFVQADGSTTRKYGGTGLGLTISKNLVDLMGGEIGVQSKEGKGSCFYFSIPVLPSAHFELQEKLKEVLALITVENGDLESCGLSAPMLALIKRLDIFSKGDRRVRLCSLGEFLDMGNLGEDFTVIVNADEILLSSRKLPANVHPLYTSVNRESLINLLYKGVVSLSQPKGNKDGAFEPLDSEHSKRILLVEDNIINAEVVMAMLAEQHIDVVHVENGELAVNFLKQYSADLVLMDVQMPIMDGYTATREIRETLHLNIPVVGLSANALPDEIKKAKSMGMNDYLAKPIIRDMLYAKMRQWLSVDKVE